MCDLCEFLLELLIETASCRVDHVTVKVYLYVKVVVLVLVLVLEVLDEPSGTTGFKLK